LPRLPTASGWTRNDSRTQGVPERGTSPSPISLPLSCAGEGDKGGEVKKMSDNVTATEITQFTSWVVPVLSAIGGAAVALIGREFIEWYRRPKLNIDFEEREGQKPYNPDYYDETLPALASGLTFRAKYLRLIVRNNGHKPTMDCEAKLELFAENEITSNTTIHWSRRDPALYSKYGEGGALLSIETEKVYAPISLNINDKEIVDVFRVIYSVSIVLEADHTPRAYPYIESVSLRQIVLQPNNTYHCKVTVYASNTVPKSFNFKVNWDGTLEGFNKAFTKE